MRWTVLPGRACGSRDVFVDISNEEIADRRVGGVEVKASIRLINLFTTLKAPSLKGLFGANNNTHIAVTLNSINDG